MFHPECGTYWCHTIGCWHAPLPSQIICSCMPFVLQWIVAPTTFTGPRPIRKVYWRFRGAICRYQHVSIHYWFRVDPFANTTTSMGKSEHHTLDNRICSLCLTIASLVMSVDQAITAAKTNALRSLNFYDGRFFGGLDKLIGPPRKDVAQAIKEEHCNVADGYGKSDQKLLSNNYNVEFTPQKEYEFVTNPDFCERMDAGTKIIVLTQFLIVPNLRPYDHTTQERTLRQRSLSVRARRSRLRS